MHVSVLGLVFPGHVKLHLLILYEEELTHEHVAVSKTAGSSHWILHSPFDEVIIIGGKHLHLLSSLLKGLGQNKLLHSHLHVDRFVVNLDSHDSRQNAGGVTVALFIHLQNLLSNVAGASHILGSHSQEQFSLFGLKGAGQLKKQELKLELLVISISHMQVPSLKNSPCWHSLGIHSHEHDSKLGVNPPEQETKQEALGGFIVTVVTLIHLQFALSKT